MKRICSFLLSVILLLSFAACGQKAEATWQEQYDLGVRYLGEGKYEEAVIAFNAAIEIDPKQADAYIGLAEVYAAQGDTEKAAEVLENAIAKIGETEELTAAFAKLCPTDNNDTGNADDNIQNDIEHNWNYEDLVGGPVYAEVVDGTLEIGNLQVIFRPGEDEDNPGSIGTAEYSFTLHGPANTCAVLIATWTAGSYPRESIDKDIVMMADVWSDMDMSDWGYPSLPASDWTARPVDAYEINTECETLLIGLDNDGNATGYVIIRSLITSDGSASGGYDTPDILTVSADLPSIDELTFFGETLTYLTASEMESSAAANGWYTSNNSDWNDGEDYYWFQASPSASGGSVSSIQYNNDTYWSFISYDHYIDFADEPSIPIGLRDIYTLDSIETVFTKLGIAGAEDIANEILGICAKYPYDEALDRLYEYSGKLYIRNEVNGTHFNIGGGSGSGPADENGVYWVESFSATLSFFTEDYIYGLDFEFTNGFLTSVRINRAPTY